MKGLQCFRIAGEGEKAEEKHDGWTALKERT